MKFPLKDPMILSCRVEGPTGKVRELSAVVDFNSTYCIMPTKDAIDIGYPSTANRPREWRSPYPDQAPYLLGMRGVEQGILIKLKRVSVGNIFFENVETVALEMELSRMLPFDFILGRSFIRDLNVTYDGKNGCLVLG
ncbi:MAG: hypothetical protein ACYCPW_06625 [Nitrososphaerales archaeon]